MKTLEKQSTNYYSTIIGNTNNKRQIRYTKTLYPSDLDYPKEEENLFNQNKIVIVDTNPRKVCKTTSISRLGNVLDSYNDNFDNNIWVQIRIPDDNLDTLFNTKNLEENIISFVNNLLTIDKRKANKEILRTVIEWINKDDYLKCNILFDTFLKKNIPNNYKELYISSGLINITRNIHSYVKEKRNKFINKYEYYINNADDIPERLKNELLWILKSERRD